MNQILQDLNDWLKQLSTFELPKWEQLPDLDLYMDQVVTYLERELAPLAVENQEKMITTWMVNNYVKGDLIPNPVQKKYSREHLSGIFKICSVKQILSISDINQIFAIQKTKQSVQESYDYVRQIQADMINHISAKTKAELEKFPPDLDNETHNTISFLTNTLIQLAIEAEVKKIIASKILYLINLHQLKDPEKTETELRVAPVKEKAKKAEEDKKK